MPELREPLSEDLAAGLRAAVLLHRSRSPRGTPPPVLAVGLPPAVVGDPVEGSAGLDHAVRCDVVSRLLRRHGPDGAPVLWLARGGEHALHDEDAAWLAAGLTAYAEAGLPLTMVVVTRRGWWDPRSGTSRVWKRLRQRRAG